MVHIGRIFYDGGKERVTITINRDEWTRTYPNFAGAFRELGRIGAVEQDDMTGDSDYMLRGTERGSVYIFMLPLNFNRVRLEDAGFECSRIGK